jgi:hypothetical protein
MLVGSNVFFSSGTHVTPPILLLTPEFEPIVFSQFLKVYLSIVGAFVGKMISALLKG